MKLAFAAVFSALVVGGCGIKKEIHQKTLADLATCQKDLSTAQKNIHSRNSEIANLEQKLKAIRAERDENSSSAKRLSSKIKATEAELKVLRKQRDKAQSRLKAYRELNKRFRSLIDTGKLKVAFRNGQMVLKLPAGILFASGKASLSRNGVADLSEVLTVLLTFPDRRFIVAGHTDNVQIRSRRFKSNWHLSTARAVSIVEFMVDAGFPPQNLSAAGYGEFDPVASNDTPQDRQLNRRIEIILVPDLSELPNLTVEPS